MTEPSPLTRQQGAKRIFRTDPLGVVGIILMLALWTAVSMKVKHLFPPPWSIAKTTIQVLEKSPQIELNLTGQGSFIPHLLYTVEGTIIGVLQGSILGLLVGLSMAMSERFREFVSPLLEFLRTVPGLAAVPFAILWFGPTRASQVIFMTYYSTMLMTVYAYEATRNVAPVYKQFAQTLGANPRQLFRHVVVPAMVPEIVGGFRVIIMAGFGNQVVAELAGASQGMGRVFLILSQYYKADQIVAGVVLIVLFAVLLDRLFVALTNRILRWVPRESG